MAAVGAHLTRTRATLPQRRDGRNNLEATRTEQGEPGKACPFRGPLFGRPNNAIIAGRCPSRGIALHGNAPLR